MHISKCQWKCYTIIGENQCCTCADEGTNGSIACICISIHEHWKEHLQWREMGLVFQAMLDGWKLILWGYRLVSVVPLPLSLHLSLLAVLLFLTSNNVLDIHRLPLKRATHQKLLSSSLLFMPKRNRMTRERFYKRSNFEAAKHYIIQFLSTHFIIHMCVCARVNVHIRLCKSWIFHIQILSYAMCMIDVIYIYLTWWCCSDPLSSLALCHPSIHFYVHVNFSVC